MMMNSCDHKLKGDEKMKVDTVQQFYVKQFLEDNFDMEYIKLTLIDRYTIRVKDCNNEEMDFWWSEEDGKVKYKVV